MNKEILVNTRSSTHHQSNEKYTSIYNKCNHMKKRTSFSPPQITISQFIQDINTNNQASLTPPKPTLKSKPIEFNPLPKSPCGYYLPSPTSIFPNSTNPLPSPIPTVPKYVN